MILILTLILLCTCPFSSIAIADNTMIYDVIKLKTGKIIEGKIVDISYWEDGKTKEVTILDLYGERLSYIGHKIESVERDVSHSLEDVFGSFAPTDTTDYMMFGYKLSQRDYKGRGAFAAGVASGCVLGIVGNVIGYVLVMNSGTYIPMTYLAAIEPEHRLEFERGYSKQTKRNREDDYIIGALIGTTVFVVAYLFLMD